MQSLNTEVGAKKFVADTDSRNATAINVLLGLGFRCNLSKIWTEDFKNEVATVSHFENHQCTPNPWVIGWILSWPIKVD